MSRILIFESNLYTYSKCCEVNILGIHVDRVRYRALR